MLRVLTPIEKRSYLPDRGVFENRTAKGITPRYPA